MSCNSNSFITGPEARMIARDSVTIFTEICEIQRAIIDAIDHCGKLATYSVVVPAPDFNPNPEIQATGTGVIDTSTRQISSATVTTTGTGYLPSTPAAVVFEAPTGTPAILGTATSDGNEITSIAILYGGSGYVGDGTELVTVDPLGSGGTGFAGYVSSVSPTEGVVLAITITSGGSGYTTNGRGQLAAPVLTTAVGTVTADSNGEIVAGTPVTITNPGAGYIDDPARTNDPTFEVTDANGSPDNVVFLPVTPMTSTLYNVDPGQPDSSAYYKTHTGQMSSPEITDQIYFVKKYFTDLGYKVQLEVNPHTMNTLQWQLKW